MSSFQDKLAARIAESEGYHQAGNSLFESYILELIGERKDIEKSDIKKLIFTAQAFQKSSDTKLKKEGAILLSMILDLFADDYPEIVPVANNTFIDNGDFPNIQLLLNRFPELSFNYNFYNSAKAAFREDLNSVEQLSFPLTDFQRSLWEDLSTGNDVITSAPTSAGKTHIILNYLLNQVARSDGAFVAILVPTRALISEVAAKIYELAKTNGYENKIEICTVPKEGSFADKTIFVMTQERLHEILLRGDISFNYLFIDEAHNISSDSRGVLLHLTIEKMLEGSTPQIIISMPSPNYQNSFSTIFHDIQFKKEITQHSPVAKILISVQTKARNLIISRHNSSNSMSIPKGFSGTSLAEIVYKLGKDQSNIVFRNRTDYCEKFADDIAKLVTEAVNDPLLEQAADYVEKFIHSEFSLARNIRKGIAFHYGPLPSSIRLMIESLAKGGQIKFIACTSTLAEGVNLPAKNLFLDDPYQPITHEPSKRIEDVSISNITGRAGRMLHHFSGNIFLINPEKWKFKDYFEDELDDEQKIPTYFKSLNEELEQVLKALNGEYAHDDTKQYKFYSIANKLIKEYANENLHKTLSAEELLLDAEQLELLQNTIITANNNLTVPSFTLEANPTVGYIQQNKLFRFLQSIEDLEQWTLPHPKSHTLYETLLRICGKLHESGVYMPTENYTLGFINTITVKWVQGNSLKDIISEQIERDLRYSISQSNSPPSVNSSVRNVIKVINNDIRFRFSNALRCYHTLLNNVIASRGLELPNIKIHSYIEVGACDDRMINLINLGLSREAEKEIDDYLSNEDRITNSVELFEIYKSGRLSDRIHAITAKEIENLFS